MLVNGIDELATRGDLLDRSIIVTLPNIPKENRRPESELMVAFELSRPLILGALLDAVCATLRSIPRV